MNESHSHPIEGIAIVGMAGKFPGANDLAAFWDNLVAGRETIATFNRDALADEEPKDDPDYVARRGVLDCPEWFDAAFFGIKPKEAEVTDPQQRLFLEACWHALEDAAIDPSRSAGPIGVYAGMSNNSYFQTHVEYNAELRHQVGSDSVMIGNEKDYLATRVAYKLNLRGPALNIYTACSTSLVAICQAVAGLQSYQCDIALAGGVSVKYPQERGYVYQDGSLFSQDGHCRAFDEKAQGTIFSNGLGVVTLKRAEDAVRDGDRIYAIIKGAALNNDGSDKVSFTAPSVSGHAEVISLAQALGGIEPDTIDYIEAHGTATPIGDPIEIAGLTEAFRAGGCTRNQFCAIGSAKTNIGHLDAAAGVAGLIKTALALHHKIIPASLHFTRANPALGLEESPFFVNTTTRPWERTDHPRRAGVSAFGLGGTNAHVVLEEAPASQVSDTGRDISILPLAAKSGEALVALREQLAAFLEAHPKSDLTEIAATLQLGRQHFSHRLAAVATTVHEAIPSLRGSEGKDFHQQVQTLNRVPVAFLFPGQGSQHIRMGAALYKREPLFRSIVEECATVLHPLIHEDLRVMMYPAPGLEVEAEHKLAETRFTQPALFVTEYALAKLLMSWGVQPTMMLGHSIGEYVAACLAGVMSLEHALRLVAARGRILWNCPRGVMLGVRATEDVIKPLLIDGVDLAAINSPHLVVLSGPQESIQAMETLLAEKQISSRRLVASHAFHSSMMESGLAEFRREWSGVELHAPQIPYISNLSGEVITDEEATSPEYYLRHIRRAVRFADGIQTIIDQGACALLEVGPGHALATMARQHPAASRAVTILSSLPSAKEAGHGERTELMRSVGRLWLSGVELDWTAIRGGNFVRRAPLPHYPFQRQRYCAERILPAGSVRVGECAIIPQGNSTVPQPQVITPTEVPQAPPVAEPVVSETIAPDRKEHLIRELRTQLHKASGIDISTAPAAASFFDLGFDSLFLTQASIFLKKHFGVKITFRQVAEELSCLEALAAYLDEKLPADKFTPSAPKPLPDLQAAVQSAGTSPVADRLALIERTIAELRQEVVNPSEGSRARFGVRALAQNVNNDKRVAFGPFRPIQTAKDGTMTDEQRTHLNELLTAYIARTRKSKEFTQKYRPKFADPRAVAGFNHLWKEAVYPLVVDRSLGGRIWDIDGNEYIDITQGFGVGFLGHRPSFVIDAVKAQLDRGIEIGPTSPLVGEVADLFLEFTGMDRVSFCDTGSEAVMAAIRTARTVSGRDKIVMFAGAYHGIMDEVLVRPMMDGDQLCTIPIAPGIPEAVGENILVLDFDNPESLEIIREHGQEIAAVLVETVQSRRPDLQPAQFLHELRHITQEAGIALVLDEVVNGFRIDPKGAAGWFGIEADIATYGKIVGGGLPIGVVAGKRKYMDSLDGGAWQYGDDSGPEVGVTFFAGTFVRHPLALAAAKAVLLHLKEKGPALQTWMNERTARMVATINAFCEEAGVPIKLTHFSSYFFVNISPQLKYTELLFHHMRLRGIHVWAGRSSFLCTQHTEEDIEQIISVWKESVRALQEGGFLPKKDSASNALPIKPAELEVVASFMPGYAPLTSAQQELLLASAISEEASIACHESVGVSIRGALKHDALHTALGTLVERHDALRASFSEDGEGMQIAANVRLPMPVVDLTHLSALDQELRCAEIKRTQFLTPFSLSHAPLLRAALVALSADHHLLLLTAHHLACDGWSFGVLLEELPKAYQQAIGEFRFTGEAPPRFDAYAAEQRMQQEAGEFDEDKSYWLNRLTNPPSPLALPYDFPKAELSHETFSTTLAIPHALTMKLKALCRERRLTMFHVLLGTWQVLLHRLSGQTDFLVGVPFAGQASAGLPSLVGHCVQFLPLRPKLDPSVSSQAFLDAVRSDVMEAMEHQNCTLGELLQELKGLSGDDRQGFVPTAFSLESIPTTLHGAGLSFEPFMNPKLRSNFQLTLYAYQGDESLKLLCAAKSSLFREETIQRWLKHYERLLEAVCASPDASISRLPMLTDDQRNEVLRGINANGRRFGGDVCLHTWFEQMVLSQPFSPALTFGETTITYASLNVRANQIAHALIRDGVRPGTLVGLCVERDISLVPAILGILKAGAAYVPIDLSYPAERVAFMLRDAAITVLVSQGQTAAKLPSYLAKMIDLDDPAQFEGMLQTNPSTAVHPDDTAYVIYTSGSTGQPKGCLVTHRNVSRLMQGTEGWFHFGSHDVWTLFHSTAFDFSVWEIWGALLFGGRLVVVPYVTTRSPDDFYKLLVDEKVTVLNQTPSAFRQLMAAEEMQPSPQELSLRYIIFGGEALEMHTLKPWFDRHGDAKPQLINMYGITETTVHVTYRPISATDLKGGSVIGVPIPDLQLYVLDAHQEPVPLGVVGEMYVGGDGLAQGYLNRADLTATRFIPDHLSGRPGARLYRTGDLARLLPGRDLEYLGRIDQQVKIRGFRIELGEIEAALSKHPSIRDAAVLAREDADGDRYLAAYVVTHGEPIATAALRDFLKTTLPDYMVPSAVVTLDQLPLTENGKLDRRALPEPGEEQRNAPVSAPSTFAAPSSDTEQRLAVIWKEVLRLPNIGVDDNFFDIGGTSLHGLKLFTKLRQEFRVALPLGTLFRAPTLAKLAALIDTTNSASKGKSSPLTCIQPAGEEIPFFGIHGGDGGAIFYKGLLPQLGWERPIYTIESPALVDESIPIEIQEIEQVASEYLAMVRRVQRRGPYVLGGYSYGGIVAYEMAQQLIQAGDEVAMVVLFDTENPNVPAREYSLGERIAVNWKTSASSNVAGKLLQLGGRFGSGLIQRLRTEAETASARKLLKQGVKADDERLRYVQIREANLESLEAYEAKPLAATMLLFRSDAVSDKFKMSPDYDWTPLVDRLIIERVPGAHLDIFDEPNVGIMAEQLRKHLDQIVHSSSPA